MTSRTLTAAAICLLVVVTVTVTAGCSGFAPAGRGDDRAAAAGDATPDWDRALALLGRGDVERAEAELVRLRAEPRHRERARHLLEQIRTPIDRYFPADHFTLRLRPGQTLSNLSDRYLDDPLAFYALARYNDIGVPGKVVTGQSIRIPLTEHARGVRARETGPPETDETIGGARDDAHADEGRTTRIRRYYRKATLAFQRQDLDRTLLYCGRVLELAPEHANCIAYRERARALQRQLKALQRDDEDEAP